VIDAYGHVSVRLERDPAMQFQALLLSGPGGKIVYMDDAEVAANVPWQD
jgi:hypothetical protein